MNEDTVLRYRIPGLKNKINHNKWLSRTIMSGSDSKYTVASMPLCLSGLSQTFVADVFKNIFNVVHLINFLWKRYEVDLTYRTTHRTQCVTDHILTRYYRWWNHHNTQKTNDVLDIDILTFPTGHVNRSCGIRLVSNLNIKNIIQWFL